MININVSYLFLVLLFCLLRWSFSAPSSPVGRSLEGIILHTWPPFEFLTLQISFAAGAACITAVTLKEKARCSRWPAQLQRCPPGPNSSLKRMFKYQCCIIIADDLNIICLSCLLPSILLSSTSSVWPYQLLSSSFTPLSALNTARFLGAYGARL